LLAKLKLIFFSQSRLVRPTKTTAEKHDFA